MSVMTTSDTGLVPDISDARRGRAVDSRFAEVAVAAAVAALPLLRPTGPGNSALVDILIAFAVITVLAWVAAAGLRLRTPYAVSVGVMVVGGSIAALANDVSLHSIVALFQDLTILAWCAAVANIARRPGQLRTILHTWAIASVAWAWLLVVAVATHQDTLAGITARTGTRAALTFGDANIAGNYFVVSIFIIAATRYPRTRPRRALAYLGLLAALALTGSNGGLIALVAGTGTVLVAGLVRRAGIVPAVALVCIVAPLVLLGAAHVGQVQRSAQDPGSILHNSIGRGTESRTSRLTLLSESFNLYLDGSLLGRGPGSTKDVLLAEQSPYAKEAHSDYTATLVERGVIGTLGLLLLLGAVGVRARVLVSRPLTPGFAAVIPRPYALLGALVAVLLSAMFYEVLHFRHVWALLGVVAAVAALGEEKRV